MEIKERLTTRQKDENKNVWIELTCKSDCAECTGCRSIKTALERLAEYEDAIESGEYEKNVWVIAGRLGFEELPPIGEWVLVYDGEVNEARLMQSTVNEIDTTYPYDFWNYRSDDNNNKVTAWRKKPAPPKSEVNKND